MDRRGLILEFVTKEQTGIEVGPWFNPLVPKREGWRSLALDVFDTQELRSRAAADPDVPPDRVKDIEEVDLVGPATRIDEIATAAGHPMASFDFVISSHNFEHLPNPVRFLRGCERLLWPGGILSMALPDKRACFDVLRSATSLSQVLEAYFEDRERPTLGQIFEHRTSGAFRSLPGGRRDHFFPANCPPDRVVPVSESLTDEFARWRDALKASTLPYEDAHCWAFTPTTLELILRDLHFLGLTGLEVERIRPTAGLEFFVHLRKPLAPAAPDPAAHYANRRLRLRKAFAESRPTRDNLSRRWRGELLAQSHRLPPPVRRAVRSLQRFAGML